MLVPRCRRIVLAIIIHMILTVRSPSLATPPANAPTPRPRRHRCRIFPHAPTPRPRRDRCRMSPYAPTPRPARVRRARYIALLPRGAPPPRFPHVVSLARGGVFEDDVPGVEHAGDPAEEAEEDVDEEGGTAAATDYDGEGREEDGEEAETDSALCRWRLAECGVMCCGAWWEAYQCHCCCLDRCEGWFRG